MLTIRQGPSRSGDARSGGRVLTIRQGPSRSGDARSGGRVLTIRQEPSRSGDARSGGRVLTIRQGPSIFWMPPYVVESCGFYNGKRACGEEWRWTRTGALRFVWEFT